MSSSAPERTPAPAAAADDGAAPPRRRVWPWVLAALVLPPLVVRGLLLEAYAIHSDSMSPAFLEGDRLIVLKDTLDGHQTARWDVVVVDRSVDVEAGPGVDAVIKRVVGLPGEWIEIRDGDVWVGAPDAPAGAPLAVARKPDDVTAGLLVPVHTSLGLGEPWRVEGAGAGDPSAARRRLVAEDGPARAVWEGTILDGRLRDGPEGDGPENSYDAGETPVHDTAVTVSLPRVQGVLEIVLQDKPDVFTVRLPPAGGAERATVHHNLDPRGVVATDGVDGRGLSDGDVVQAWNVDGGVRVFVNGERWLAWDRPAPRRRIEGMPVVNGPILRVPAGAVEVGLVVVSRDLHYTAQGTHGTDPAGGLTPARVPPDGLFLLGDASRTSRDSRYFGPVPRSAVFGRPVAIYAPWERAGRLVPAGHPAGAGRP